MTAGRAIDPKAREFIRDYLHELDDDWADIVTTLVHLVERANRDTDDARQAAVALRNTFADLDQHSDRRAYVAVYPLPWEVPS